MGYTYLDWAATAIPDPEALEVCSNMATEYPGNPSSLHEQGRRAEKQLEAVRKGFARLLCCPDNSVIFTGSGTESNNIIFTSLPVQFGHSTRTRKVVISGTEHASVYEPAQILKIFGFTVSVINPESDGIIDINRFLDHIDETTVLASFMHVNNETGAVQPVETLSKAVKEKARRLGRKVHVHVDAVQSLGKLPFSAETMDIDSASASAHKLGAPRGAGLLYLRHKIPVMYQGGGQEMGIRPGTENLAGAAAFYSAAKAAVSAMDERFRKVGNLREYLLEKLHNFPEFTTLPGYDPRRYSPYIIPVFFPPVPGEVLARFLNEEGIALSTGSACSGRKRGESRVLEAMGIPKLLALSAVRVSLGHRTSLEDLDNLVAALKRTLPKLVRLF